MTLRKEDKRTSGRRRQTLFSVPKPSQQASAHLLVAHRSSALRPHM